MSPTRAGAVPLAIVLVLTALSGAVHAQDTSLLPVDDGAADDPVEIRIGEGRDAEADYVAVSLQGDSEALVALSGDGTADGLVAASGTGDAAGTMLAAAGTGTAGGLVAVSGTGAAVGVVPFSVVGTCNGESCYQIDFSGSSEAYYVSYSHSQRASSDHVAASGEDTATCRTSACVAASGEDTAQGGLVAASGTGSSEGSVAAASGTGDAYGGFLAASGTGDVSGFAGVTGTGDAGWFIGVSGCEAAKATDVGQVSNRACVDHPAEILP